MRRGAVGAFVLAVAFILAALAIRGKSHEPPAAAAGGGSPGPVAAAPAASEFHDEFAGPTLDPARWTSCSAGDFKEKVVDVHDGRLRLRVGTIGTDDKTVKFLGARVVPMLRLGRQSRISAELDWNKQANGSYLSAALILSPQAVSGNPLEGPDWIRVEYVGVPPGRNGRLVVASRTGGRERYLYLEGWPEKNREGRLIQVQRIDLVVNGGGFEVLENGERVYECTDKVIGFSTAYLYLQMSSHSNYPPREVFFDNVRWSVAD